MHNVLSKLFSFHLALYLKQCTLHYTVYRYLVIYSLHRWAELLYPSKNISIVSVLQLTVYNIHCEMHTVQWTMHIRLIKDLGWRSSKIIQNELMTFKRYGRISLCSSLWCWVDTMYLYLYIQYQLGTFWEQYNVSVSKPGCQ